MESTTCYQSEFEVKTKLHEFGCDINRLQGVALTAISARNEATHLHPQNAPGQLSYLAGVAALRNLFLRLDGWDMYNVRGVEGVRNKNLGVIILFQNVDFACGIHEPRPICPKRAGVTKLVDNGTLCLFGDMAGEDGLRENKEVWFFCVANRSEEPQAELSRPSRIEDGIFGTLLERIFVLTSDGTGPQAPKKNQNSDPESIVDDFDVSISRKG